MLSITEVGNDQRGGVGEGLHSACRSGVVTRVCCGLEVVAWTLSSLGSLDLYVPDHARRLRRTDPSDRRYCTLHGHHFAFLASWTRR